MYTMVIPSRQRLSNNACKKKNYKLYFTVFYFFLGKRSETKTFEAEKTPVTVFHFFFLFGVFDPRELLISMFKVSSDIFPALMPFTALNSQR